ncbi:unnamed protein product (mitochondrion) [Musa textilis]
MHLESEGYLLVQFELEAVFLKKGVEYEHWDIGIGVTPREQIHNWVK